MRRIVVAVAVVLVAAACGSNGSTDVSAGDRNKNQSATFTTPAGTSRELVAQTARVMQRRFDALGVDDVSIDVDGNQLTVEVPAGSGGDHALDVAARTGDLQFRPVLATREPGATFLGANESQAGLPDADGTEVYDLGPVAVSGDAVEQATAEMSDAGQWTVSLVITTAGIDAFNQVAAMCFAKAPACPTGRLAIVLEGVVESAPTIQAERFDRDHIQISGSFSEREAKDLAAVLQAGSLPVVVHRVAD